MSLERGILLLSDDGPTQASGCYSWFGFIIIWGQCILPFSTSKSEVLCSPLVSSLLLFNGMDFLYLSKLLGNINVLAQMSLLLTFYPQVSCYRSTRPCPAWDRRVSSWFFLCLCSLSHLQAVPILDPVAKVFSPSFTTHFLPSYNRAHHLIRDVNSCKESFSHMYFLFQEASLKIQNKQCVHLQWVLLDLSGITQNCVSIFQTASKNTLEGTIAKWSLYLTLSYVSALCILQKAFQELGSRNGQWVCTLAWPYCHGTNQCSKSHMCLADFVKWFI